jgi:hypothetical protein
MWFGLHVMAQLASCWAVTDHADGKTVSAVIKIDNRSDT